jgi:hypothetical protein
MTKKLATPPGDLGHALDTSWRLTSTHQLFYDLMYENHTDPR